MNKLTKWWSDGGSKKSKLTGNEIVYSPFRVTLDKFI